MRSRIPRHIVWPTCLLVGLLCTSAAAQQDTGNLDGAEVDPFRAPAGLAAPYVLQVGDEIEIRAFGIEEISDTVRIRPDGRVSFLLIDDVVAAGQTTEAFDRRVTELYSEFYLDPRVTIILRNFANQAVYVGGEVARPGLLPLTGEESTLSAILRAGGFRDSASQSSVMLLRQGADGIPEAARLNVKDVISGKEMDVLLRPFDVVYVPKKFISKANLFVKEYMRDLLPIATTANFSWILGATRGLIP